MTSTDWNGVRARRLERSSLAERGDAGKLTPVADELCGVQAQVQLSAELQLAARIDGLVQGDVRDALWSRRELVKAWTVRGTLHLHPASELALWHAARRAVTPEARHEGLEIWRDPAGGVHPPLDGGEVEAVRAAVWDVLDGRCLLREELADEVVKRLGPAPRERLRSGFAFFMDELCQGPPRGARSPSSAGISGSPAGNRSTRTRRCAKPVDAFCTPTARHARSTSASGSGPARSR